MYKLFPIDAYFFKKKRLENNLTLNKLSIKCGINSSYLNKIEKQKIYPSPRRKKIILHTYCIKEYSFMQYSSTPEYTLDAMHRLYYVNFNNHNYTYLLKIIDNNKNSRYIGHLDLINCCYKMLYAKDDQNLNLEEKLIFEYLQSFESFEQEFFLLCKMIYYARKREKDIYIQCQCLLKKINKPQWIGLKFYAQLNADFYFQNFSDMLKDISLCKKIYINEKNQNRYNSTMLFEAMFYHNINCLDNAIKTYKILSKRYYDLSDMNNYGICQHNIGSLFSEKKEFKLAIKYYENASQILYENDTFFELAWCYYLINEKSNCKKTIHLGLKANTQYDAYILLSKWLLLILDSPNSKRSLNILLKIENDYFNTLGPNAQKLLYIAIANYYTSIQNYQKSNEYLKKISTTFINTIIDIK